MLSSVSINSFSECRNLIAIKQLENDIPMFEVVHRSYCIDHTSPIVKEHSDYVVESVEKVIELELNREQME